MKTYAGLTVVSLGKYEALKVRDMLALANITTTTEYTKGPGDWGQISVVPVYPGSHWYVISLVTPAVKAVSDSYFGYRVYCYPYNSGGSLNPGICLIKNVFEIEHAVWSIVYDQIALAPFEQAPLGNIRGIRHQNEIKNHEARVNELHDSDENE